MTTEQTQMQQVLDQNKALMAQLEALKAAAGAKPGKIKIPERDLDAVVSASETVCGTKVQARTFKSGSRGYYGSGKIMIAGEKYQCSVTLVVCGSKPK